MNENAILRRDQKVLAPGMAERLAELYLPVRLRDYWLLAHPLVQAHIFTHSTSPEEFFTNVDMEFSRHVSWKHKFSSQNSWKQEIKMIDSITEVRLLPGG